MNELLGYKREWKFWHHGWQGPMRFPCQNSPIQQQEHADLWNPSQNETQWKATEALKPPTVLLELTGVPVEGHDPPVVAALVVLGQLHGSSVQRRDSQVGDVFNLRNENSLSVDKKNISKLLLLTENIFNSYFKKSQL